MSRLARTEHALLVTEVTTLGRSLTQVGGVASTQSTAQHGKPNAEGGRAPQPIRGTGAVAAVGRAQGTAWTHRTTEPVGEGALGRAAHRRGKGRETGVSPASSLARRMNELGAQLVDQVVPE
jgi:hypothetical protein